MSADNWAMCPRCVYRHELRAVRLREEADTAYGKVPVEEWKRLDADALEATEPLTEATFREDYEVGVIESGVIVVSYSGGCTVCNLSASLKQEQPLEGIRE